MKYYTIYTNRIHVICLLLLLMQCVYISIYATPINAAQAREFPTPLPPYTHPQVFTTAAL